MRAPQFWFQKKKSLLAFLLLPIAKIYGFFSAKRRVGACVAPYVICVGNISLGGTGKTPLVQKIAKHLKSKGVNVVILLRGYRGQLGDTPVVVNNSIHNANDVGDEALLHAAIVPTIVSKNRFMGASLAEEIGADVILMDDGLQHDTLKKDFSICVVGEGGFGNGCVFPAGPLRQSLASAKGNIDQFVFIGQNTPEMNPPEILDRKTLLQAHAVINPDDWGMLRSKKLVAFAGLGDPDKFFKMLESSGLTVHESHAFPDHYSYSMGDLEKLLNRAQKSDAVLVTTQKDFVKMPESFKNDVHSVRMQLEFKSDEKFKLLMKVLEANILEAKALEKQIKTSSNTK